MWLAAAAALLNSSRAPLLLPPHLHSSMRTCYASWQPFCADIPERAAATAAPLQDGSSKMSKSAENDASRINLTDTPDAIRNKVRCNTAMLRFRS
jgi:hypothetical protein